MLWAILIGAAGLFIVISCVIADKDNDGPEA